MVRFTLRHRHRPLLVVGWTLIGACSQFAAVDDHSSGEGAAPMGRTSQRLTELQVATGPVVRLDGAPAGGAEADRIAISSTTLVVASPFGHPEVRILNKATNGWEEAAAFDVTEATNAGHRSLAVAASDGVVAASAPFQLLPLASDVEAPVHASVVQVWVRSGGEWKNDAVLTSPEGDGSSTHYGIALAVRESTLFVGAPHSEPSGAVFVYERNARSWELVGELRSDSTEHMDRLGWSVGFDGTTLAVGAPFDASGSEGGPGGDTVYGTGAVHLFKRDPNGTWFRTSVLKGPDAPGKRSLPNPCHGMGCQNVRPFFDLLRDRFGESVSLADGVLVVGAPGGGRSLTVGGRGAEKRSGAAYIFERTDDGGYEHLARLEPPDSSPLFGATVDTRAGVVAVGTPESYDSSPAGVPIPSGAGVVRLYSVEGGSAGSTTVRATIDVPGYGPTRFAFSDDQLLYYSARDRVESRGYVSSIALSGGSAGPQ